MDDPYQSESAAKPDMPKDSEQDSEESALVPKSLVGDAKVGDVCKFKVVHLYEDEAEIEYVDEANSDKSESSEDEMGDPFAKMGGMKDDNGGM